MNARSLLLAALPLLSVVDWVQNYAALPQFVATHFGPGGRPDGWRAKSSALISLNAMTFGLALLFIAPPWLIRRTPGRWISVPRQSYWMAEERRAETLELLAERLWLLGVVTLLLLLFVNYLVIRANRVPEPRLPEIFWLGFAAYLVAVGAWTVDLILRFRKPGS